MSLRCLTTMNIVYIDFVLVCCHHLHVFGLPIKQILE